MRPGATRRSRSTRPLRLAPARSGSARPTSPRVAQKAASYRIVRSGPTQAGTVDFVFDIVGLMDSRAQASIFIGSALRPQSRAEEVRLARLVSGRMAKVMRGA